MDASETPKRVDEQALDDVVQKLWDEECQAYSQPDGWYSSPNVSREAFGQFVRLVRGGELLDFDTQQGWGVLKHVADRLEAVLSLDWEDPKERRKAGAALGMASRSDPINEIRDAVVYRAVDYLQIVTAYKITEDSAVTLVAESLSRVRKIAAEPESLKRALGRYRARHNLI